VLVPFDKSKVKVPINPEKKAYLGFLICLGFLGFLGSTYPSFAGFACLATLAIFAAGSEKTS
jgi:hypothetical protein